MSAPYVELHCHSAYSFLDGASLPEELALRAAELGYEALALTDHDGVYGSLEFAHAAKAFGLRPITGAEVTLADGSHLTLLVETPAATPTSAACSPPRTRTGASDLDSSSASWRTATRVSSRCPGVRGRGSGFAIPMRPHGSPRSSAATASSSSSSIRTARGDVRRNSALRDLAETLGVRTIATGNVHVHHPRRVQLQDVLVAIKNRTSLEGCEAERRGNDESVLRSPEEAAARFPDDPDAVRATLEFAERLEFDLTEELGYRYPDFSDGEEPADAQLARVCGRAFDERYSTSQYSLRHRAAARLREELALIAELGLSGFFLLHWEVLELARQVATEVRGHGSPRHLLPPGRGRGAPSARWSAT